LFIGKGPTTVDGFNGLIDDVGVWHGELSAERIAAIAGLGYFAGVDLASSEIDDILSLSAPGEMAMAGGIGWDYVDLFPAAADATALTAGLHYLGVDNWFYIILDDDGQGGFTGIRAAPEPATGLLLALGTLLCLAPRRKTRRAR